MISQTQPVHKDAVNQEIDGVFYPETDGRPMAESDLHREIMFYIIHLLQRFFAGQKVYVSGNLLIYYEQGNRYKSVAPDCFVVRGIETHKRRTYKIWEEGIGPEVVFEVSSKSTSNEDLTTKFGLYARLGVKEYFVYDPTSDYLSPPLIGYELVEGQGFVPMQPLNQEVVLGDLVFVPGESEPPEFESKLMSLRLTLDEHNDLVLYDVRNRQRLLSDEEARIKAEEERRHAEEERQRAEEERQRAEEERRHAEEERQRAEEERQRAVIESRQSEQARQRAEEENRRLQQEISRLKQQLGFRQSRIDG